MHRDRSAPPRTGEPPPTRIQQGPEQAPRTRVVVGVSAIALVLLVALAGVIRDSDRVRRQSLEERAAQRTAIAGNFIEAANADLQASIRSHAEHALAGPAPTAAEFATINDMMRFRAAVLLDADGRVLQAYPDDPALLGEDLAARYDHLRRAVDGDTAVSGVVTSAVEDEPFVELAVPFDTPEGRRVYSAGYHVKDTPLGSYLLHASVLPGEHLYLVDSAGAIIASSEPTSAGTLAEQHPELAAAAMDGDRGMVAVDGADVFFNAVPIDGAPWRLVRELPADALYAPADQGRWVPWVLFGGFLVVGVASIVMLSWIIGQRDDERHRAGRDPLTGLANRRQLDVALAVRRAADDPRPWSVLMIDVDNFKDVNDELGHQRGDLVLEAVAGVIAGAARRDDVVGRWGGEEFMVVAAGAPLRTAADLAERIRGAVAERRPGGVAITVSVGYSSTETVPADGLVDLADASLYRAKRSGRDRCVALTADDAFPALVPDPEPEPEPGAGT